MPAIAALYVGALYIARASVPLRFERDLAQPLAVVTNWGAAAMPVLLAGCVGAACAYAGWLHIRKDAPFMVQPATLLILLATPLVLSSDVYAYAAYGWQGLHGVNPYAGGMLPPGAFGSAVRFQWPLGLPACVYGPLFVGIAACIALLQPLGVCAELFAFRMLACAALIAAYAGARRAYGSSSQAAYVALHPAVLWSAAEGHNDAIAAALLVWSATPARSSRAVAAFLAFFAAAVKSAAALPIAAFAIGAGRDRMYWRLLAIACLVVAVAPAALTAGRSGTHSYYPQVSAAAVGFFTARLAGIAPAAVPVSLLLAGALALALAARAFASRIDAPLECYGYLALAAWALVPNPQPWYAIWLLAAAALAPESRAARAAGAVALLALLRYVPDAFGVPPDAASLLLAALATMPLLLAAVSGRRTADSFLASR